MGFQNSLLSFAAISLVSAFLVGRFRRWAQQREMLDIPNQRSSHTKATPRGGGVVIVVICVLGLGVYQLASWRVAPSFAACYGTGAVLIAAISWLDDLRSVPSLIRFALHATAAAIIVLGCTYWSNVTIPLLGSVKLGWIGALITLLWIVGLTNAYNFMDGIDGIAGTQAVIAGLGWWYLGEFTGQTFVSVLGLLTAASSLGFLVYNRPPARIFMGDVGSAFLGYTFAALPVLASQGNPRLCVAGILLVWPFVFDTTLTISLRLWRGENVLAAHRSHLYQHLVIAGWKHGTVTVLYGIFSAGGAVLAILFVTQPGRYGWLIVSAVPMVAMVLFSLTHSQEQRRHTTGSGGRVATDELGEQE